LSDFARYWSSEKQWCKDVVEGNKSYYNTGTLPGFLPSVLARPTTILCETVEGLAAPAR
jgi:hypothetical protein